MPTQNNGSDCGVFAIKFAECVGTGRCAHVGCQGNVAQHAACTHLLTRPPAISCKRICVLHCTHCPRPHFAFLSAPALQIPPPARFVCIKALPALTQRQCAAPPACRCWRPSVERGVLLTLQSIARCVCIGPALQGQ